MNCRPLTRHRTHSKNVARIGTRSRTRFCVALSAILFLPGLEAAAARFEHAGLSITAQSSSNPYTAEIYEWRETNGVWGSLSAGCDKFKAPIVVLFHGGTGMDPGNTVLNAQMAPLAQRLSRSCVRMVAVQGTAPMNGNAPKTTYVRDNTTFTAYNMYRAMQKIMRNGYPDTTNVVLFSGSMGGVTASALMSKYYGFYTDELQIDWKKLDRFVLNVPAGNVYDTCTPLQTQVPFVKDFTGFADCQSMINHVNANWQPKGWSSAVDYGHYLGATASPFTSSQIATFKSKAQLHVLVGSADTIMAPYSGPQGAENYLRTANLYDSASRYTDALPPASDRISFITITGAGHGNLWDYNTSVTAGICQLMARRFDERDTRAAGIESNCN